MGSFNESGRLMTKYPKTKSDPICKWRNASVDTVVELVGFLPKQRMSKDSFRYRMSDLYDGAFFRTPYQLALQLALYYEDEKEYIPRFDHNISQEEAKRYMQKWMQRYYVPNPFTKRGFINIVPSINLLYGLVDYLENHPNKPNLATAGAALFGGEMGNILCVRYVLNEYSNIIKVDRDNEMTLLLHKDGKIDVYNDRDDKKAFFEHFT
jgi:hypothetical protein